jgi:DegV family protein with EDD domain
VSEPTPPVPQRRVAVVTDSTASLSEGTAASHGVTVVPLEVLVGDETHTEGASDLSSAELATAMREEQQVATSRPNPEIFIEVYRRLADEGYEQIVSLHLSAELSGTYDSAVLAAQRAPVPVVVVDTRQVGMGTGFAVLAAAEAVAAGADAEAAGEAGRRRADATTSWFYVDNLEHLRRGGRIGAATAMLGSALSVKPLLRVEDGRVVPGEKVRTTSRAMLRMAHLAVDAAEHRPVDVAVAHLDNPTRALDLAATLGEWLDDELEGRDVALVEIGAVLGAHVGPGMVGVAVAPRL